jgi:HSP20 family molecular chaperone IbpA
METNKEPMLIGIVTLLIGLGLGVGLGAWFVKGSQAADPFAAQQTFTSPASQKSPSTDIKGEGDPFREMERMHEKINRATRNSTDQFEFGSGATIFRPDAGYSSSFDLRDRKDHYELRAYLLDVKASDVNVRIDNDRTLHVSVKQRKHEKSDTTNGSASFSELGEYEQVVTLPEPVKSSEMKIDRRGHEMVITIPKSQFQRS